MSELSELRSLRAEVSLLRAELMGLKTLVEYCAQATRTIEAAAKDTARETGQQETLIEAAREDIRAIQDAITGTDGLGPRLRVVEELYKRRVAPTPQATAIAPQGELATLEIEKTKARWQAFATAVPAAIKVVVVGGAGAAIVKAIEWVKEALHK